MLFPPTRPVLPETEAVASGSFVRVSTTTALVRAGTVMVPSTATVDPFTLMLLIPVSAEGSATKSVTV